MNGFMLLIISIIVKSKSYLKNKLHNKLQKKNIHLEIKLLKLDKLRKIIEMNLIKMKKKEMIKKKNKFMKKLNNSKNN